MSRATQERVAEPTVSIRDELKASWFGVVVGIALAIAAIAFIQMPVPLDSGELGIAWVFRETKWLLLSMVLFIWCVVLLAGIGRREAVRFSLGDLAVFGLFLLFCLSLLWTPDMDSGTASVQRAGLVLGVLISFRATNQSNAKGILGAFTVFSCLAILFLWFVPLPPAGQEGIGLFRLRSQGGFGNENFFAEFELGVGALAFALWAMDCTRVRWVFLVVSAVLLAHVLFFSPTNLKYLALLGIGMAVLAVRFGGSPTFKTFALVCGLGGVAIVLVALPLTVPALLVDLPASFAERAQIWAGTLEIVANHPLVGTGVAGFYHDYPMYMEAHLLIVDGHPINPYSLFARLPVAAESDYLHLAAELGLLGIVAALFVVSLYLYMLICSAYRWLTVPVVVLLVLAAVSFPLQNPGTLILLAVIVGATEHVGGLRLRSPLWLVRLVVMAPLCWALLVIPSGYGQVQAAIREGRAIVYEMAGQRIDSAIAARDAINYSVRDPTIRMQAFTRVMVNGFAVDRSLFTQQEIQQLHEQATRAAPHAPLMLDLWAKYLLANPPVDTSEFQETLTKLRISSGRTSPTSHILSAVLALGNGDLDAAEESLSRARELLNDSETNESNLSNIEALERELERQKN